MGRLPWLTHISTAVLVFPCLLTLVIHDYGLVRHDPYPSGLMSPGVLGFAWLVTIPPVIVEVGSAPTQFRWVTRGMAVGGTAFLAVVGSTPVSFQLDADPITHAEVRSAVINYLVLLVGHLVLITGVYVCSAVMRRRRVRDLVLQA